MSCIKQQKFKINVKKTLQFINPCGCRINRIKQQKLALPISPTLGSYSGCQLILQSWLCQFSKTKILNCIIQDQRHKIIFWLELAFIEQTTNYPVIRWDSILNMYHQLGVHILSSLYECTLVTQPKPFKNIELYLICTCKCTALVILVLKKLLQLFMMYKEIHVKTVDRHIFQKASRELLGCSLN